MAVLPQEMVTRIGRAYSAGQQWLMSQGESDSESVEVALAVEAHRWFWKPAVVKTVLITNLRGHTVPSDLGNRVKVGWIKQNNSSPPDSFVRSFYCLGYGEPEIAAIDAEANKSDLMVWHALAELAEFDELPHRADLLRRLEWKVRLLRRLDKLGLWVWDATLHGERGERSLISINWENYLSRLVESLDSPQIVAFGKTLNDELLAAGVPVEDFVYHPKGVIDPQQRQHQETVKQQIHHLSPARQN